MKKKKGTQKNKRWVQLSRPFCWQPHGTGVSWWQNRSHLGSTDFLLPEKKDNDKLKKGSQKQLAVSLGKWKRCPLCNEFLVLSENYLDKKEYLKEERRKANMIY